MDRAKLGTGPSHSPGKTLPRWLSGFLVLAGMLVAVSLAVSIGGPTTAQVPREEEKADFPALFRVIDRHLEASYLDLDRARPRVLVERALSALELSADEIYVEAPDPGAPYVAVHLNDKVRVFPLNRVEDRRQAISLLESVFDFLQRNYRGEVPLIELRYAAANGYLQALDPHTLVFSPESFQEFEDHIKGEIGGVGMLVGMSEDGRLQVKQVLKDTPAWRAGFKRGDIIVKINDESTINMTVMEAVKRIRGPLGSEVVLTVKRQNPKDKSKLETLVIPVRRALVTIKSVESKLLVPGKDGVPAELPSGVGYLKVVNFDAKTYGGFRDNLLRLRDRNRGTIAALILDLRGNSGGLLRQAVDMCDYFLRYGDIVITARKGRDSEYEFEYTRARNQGTEPDYPIIVLADEASASGAEIVIGALKEHNRALVLGTPTFGKGSVQQLHALPNGAQLKLTVSEYLLPGKISIQETGVIPHVLARGVVLTEEESDLVPNENVWTERSYESHIVSKFKKEEEPSYRVAYLEPSSEEEGEDALTETERFMSGELQPEKDPLVQMALKVLASAAKDSEWNPRRLLATRTRDFKHLSDDMFAKVVAKLAELGVDWSAPPPGRKTSAAPQVELEIETRIVQEPSGDPEDPVPVNKLVVTARARNKGTEPLYRIKGISRSDYSLYREHEFLFGKIPPDTVVERTRKIRLPYFPHAQNNLFTIELSGEDDQVFLRRSVEVPLERKPRPEFAYRAELRSDAGGVISDLAPGDHVTLKVEVKNVGHGPAHKGAAILRNKTGKEVFLERGRIEFADLDPGAVQEVEFRFRIREGERDVEAYDFELTIADSYSSEALVHKFSIPPRAVAARTPGAVPFPNGEWFRPPEIELLVTSAGGSEPILVTDGDRARIAVKVRADVEAFSTWVTTLALTPRHRMPDKTYFRRSEGDRELAFETFVPLTEGSNLITVTAKDSRGLENRASAVIRRREEGAGKTVSEPRTAKAEKP